MKNRKRSAKSIEARQALSAASRLAKKQIEVLAGMTGEVLTVNQMLMRDYEHDTQQTDFRMFHSWRKEGFCVIKGETGYRIWGTPIKAKKQKENDEEGEFSMFPICVLFHIGQVEKVEL